MACGSRRAAVSMSTAGPPPRRARSRRSTSTPSMPGHRHVEQHELGLALVDLAQRLDAALRRAHAVAVLGEDRLVEGERVGEVVDDEHVAARRRPSVDRRRAVAGRSLQRPVAARGRRHAAAAPGRPDRRRATRGRTSVKVEPSPSLERASISPPSARASRRDSARPDAGALVAPPVARLELVEVLEELLHRVGRDADAGVAHGELDLARRGASRVSTTSPSSVNLIAFESRLSRICRTRCASVIVSTAPSPTSTARRRSLPLAQAVHLGHARARELRRRSPAPRRTSTRPASAFARSSTSLMRPEQVLAVALDALERLARARRELLLGRGDEQVGEAEDGRQRACAARGSSTRGTRSSPCWRASSRSPCSVSATLFSRRRSWVHALCSATGELPRGVAHDSPASSARAVDAAEHHRARALVAERDRVGEDPAQRRRADAEVELRQRLAQRLGAQEQRLAPLHHALGQPVGAEDAVVDRAAVGGARLHRARGGRRRRAGTRRPPARRRGARATAARPRRAP